VAREIPRIAWRPAHRRLVVVVVVVVVVFVRRARGEGGRAWRGEGRQESVDVSIRRVIFKKRNKA